MIEVKRYITLGGREPFTQWLDSLDPPTRSKIQVVLERMYRGILSDIKSLGGGLFEGRINFGPGYRIYLSGPAGGLLYCWAAATKEARARIFDKRGGF